MTGPLVIVGHPRSGSRLLTHLLRENGVFMGADLHPQSLDSVSWHQNFVAPLITSSYFPLPTHDNSLAGVLTFARKLLRETEFHFWEAHDRSQPWGWKVCESLFVIPVLRELFPETRFLHIIRDARDVCLSNRGFFGITGREPKFWTPANNDIKIPTFREFAIAAAFGDPGVREWRGLDVTSPATLVRHRFLLQAHSWVTSIDSARVYGVGAPDYYEVRYEELCGNSRQELQKLSAWLQWPLAPSATINTSRMHKWVSFSMSRSEQRDFAEAIELAAPLLQNLGYCS